MRPGPTSAAPVPKAFWLLPLPLEALQAWVSWKFSHEIRYEELWESVRNVYWLDHHRIFDGGSSNVGWYGTLLVWYKLFGFSLFAAKIVRLIFHLTALYCVADILRRGLGTRLAWAPLLVIGLSPTALYFEAVQTSYGLDLPYAAICLWLTLASAGRRWPEPVGLALAGMAGFTAMVAAMSFPTFLFYLPSLAMVGWLTPACSGSGSPDRDRLRRWRFGCAGVGFVTPFAAALRYLSPARPWLWDPIARSGVFRGGGGRDVGFQFERLRQALVLAWEDLFVRGSSYYFELTRPEFSGLLARVAILWVVATVAFAKSRSRTQRLAVGAALLLIAVNFLGVSCASAEAGMRRSTGLIVAYFVLFTLAWQYWSAARRSSARFRLTGLGLCLMLPIALALKLPSLLADGASNHAEADRTWFALRGSPSESLAFVVASLDQGKVLGAVVQGRVVRSRYDSIYAAVGGWHRWNEHRDPAVLACDWRTQRVIALSPQLWAQYYFGPH